MRRLRWIACAGVIAGAMVVHRGHAEDPEPTAPPDFRGQVWPIIKGKCLACHNPKKHQGGLDMSSLAAMLKGGHSGPALVRGETDKSLMIELIEFDEMPPRKQKEGRVSKSELKTLRDWIVTGANGPDRLREYRESR